MKTKNDNGITELKFEEAMGELESIIDKLEGGEPSLTLEESLELYKEVYYYHSIVNKPYRGHNKK